MQFRLDTIKKPSLQDMQAVLGFCKETGVTVEQMQEMVLKELARRDALEGIPSSNQKVAHNKICPSCGRSVLLPAASIEGLRRRGCKFCRYSEVY